MTLKDTSFSLNELGEIFKKGRLMVNLTLRHVANRTGIGSARLSRIERGLSRPTCDEIDIIFYTLRGEIGKNIHRFWNTMPGIVEKDIVNSLPAFPNPKVDPNAIIDVVTSSITPDDDCIKLDEK